MKIVVTGSAGHLGEGLCRTLKEMGHEVTGIDILPSPFTSHQGSITDFSFVHRCLADVEAVFHLATLHKPHVATHGYQDFIDTNVTGTLNLLRAAVERSANQFIFTSTTSVFGEILTPPVSSPASWITEELQPIPKNIYGVTKSTAEDLCLLFHKQHFLNCIILRTSRFFPEADDNHEMRQAYSDQNLKTNEYLFRRVELSDVVQAHICALNKVRQIRFGKYIISATTPFSESDRMELRQNAAAVVTRLFPEYQGLYATRNWKMLPTIDRVYVNEKARKELDWQPHYDFKKMLDLMKTGKELQSELSQIVGSKGYHMEAFSEGPYPVL